MSYKLSVILPTYNAEKYLLESVQSIIDQSIGFENIELILVDDGSVDGTIGILNELSEKYENVKSYFLEENTGSASEPRNVGIKKSTTDYIMFLDSDDIYYPQMCETLYETMISENSDIVSCRYDKQNKNSFETPYSFLDNFNTKDHPSFNGSWKKDIGMIKLESVDDFPNIMTLGYPTMVWNKIYRKSVILDNNIEFPKGEFYDDVLFTSHFYLYARNIILLNEFKGYCYQLREEEENKSVSQKFSKNMLKKQLGGYLKVMDLFKDTNFDILKSEITIDMTKIFIYADLDKNCQKRFLEIMKPYYREYSLSQKLQIVNLPFNIILNIFIKIFANSDRIPIFLADLYKFFKNYLFK